MIILLLSFEGRFRMHPALTIGNALRTVVAVGVFAMPFRGQGAERKAFPKDATVAFFLIATTAVAGVANAVFSSPFVVGFGIACGGLSLGVSTWASLPKASTFETHPKKAILQSLECFFKLALFIGFLIYPVPPLRERISPIFHLFQAKQLV